MIIRTCSVSTATQTASFPRDVHFSSNKVALCFLRMSDYLSLPVFHAMKCCQMIRFMDAFYPHQTVVDRRIQKVIYAMGLLAWGVVALFSILPALVFKAIGSCLLDTAFFHAQGAAPVQALGKNQRIFTLLSWNVCCLPGHSPASGIFPAAERVERIADKVIEQNADVVVLSEVFDISTATHISHKLASYGYTRFFSHMDKRRKIFGFPSGLYVATKFEVGNPTFTPFDKNAQIERGVFSFDLLSKQTPFARICTTHMSGSDVPASPQNEERAKRQQQMQTIFNQLPQKLICTVIAGDLNLDDGELEEWEDRVDKGKVTGEKTWGGDHACVAITGGKASDPLNLDHALVLKNGTATIRTDVRQVGFDSEHLNQTALSDHALLYSLIRLKESDAPQSLIQ